MKTITVVCPKGHEMEIMNPNTKAEQLIGVDADGVHQFGVVKHDTVIVKCLTCFEAGGDEDASKFEHEIEA